MRKVRGLVWICPKATRNRVGRPRKGSIKRREKKQFIRIVAYSWMVIQCLSLTVNSHFHQTHSSSCAILHIENTLRLCPLQKPSHPNQHQSDPLSPLRRSSFASERITGAGFRGAAVVTFLEIPTLVKHRWRTVLVRPTMNSFSEGSVALPYVKPALTDRLRKVRSATMNDHWWVISKSKKIRVLLLFETTTIGNGLFQGRTTR